MTWRDYLNVLLETRYQQAPEVREVAETLETMVSTPEMIAYLSRLSAQSSERARVSEVAFELLQYLTGNPEWVAA